MSYDEPRNYEGAGTIDRAWATVCTAFSDCHEKPPGSSFTKEDIDRVFYCWERSYVDWADTNSYAVFRLKSGKYVVASEWSDSSGHG
jgi:hypothetical protein